MEEPQIVEAVQMKKNVATLLHRIPCLLGEGPLWHATRKSIFWTDIEARAIHELTIPEGHYRHYEIGHRVGMIAEGVNAGLILGMQGGFGRYDPDTDKLDWLADLEKDKPNNRANDGGCDAKGRFWIGTMDMDFKKGAGSLYRIGEDLLAERLLDQVTISNGLAWSKDNGKAYYIDSPTRTVQSFLFDVEKGMLSPGSIAVRIPEYLGTPDGMCMDEEGMLWIAHWGGFGVYRWNPIDGELLELVMVPVPNVSSCAFGGEGFDKLFITTARQGLTENELKMYPDSGSLYCVKLDIKGKAIYKCSL